jgi:peptidoglycan/LPS O-acetylase OafA/YrhL
MIRHAFRRTATSVPLASETSRREGREGGQPIPGASPRAARHLAYVDGLRFLLAFFVLVSHIYSKTWPPFYNQHPTGATAAALSWMEWYAHYAVSAFIVVSGFCLMLPVLRNGDGIPGGGWFFLLRRAWRILPTFYASLALTLALIVFVLPYPSGSNFDAGLPVTPQNLAATALLMQDMLAPNKINGVLWSIGVEWRIYFLFPLLVPLWALFERLRSGLGTVVLFVVGSAIPTLVCATIWQAWFGWPFNRTVPVWLAASYVGVALGYISLFCCGMVAACIGFALTRPSVRGRAVRRLGSGTWLSLAIGAFGAMAALVWMWEQAGHGGMTNQQIVICDAALGVGCSALLIGGMLPHGAAATLMRSAMGWRPLAFLGTFAYSIYLMHNPLQQVVYVAVVRPLGLSGLDSFGAQVAATPVVLAGCYLFFLAFERPFLSARPIARFAQRRSASRTGQLGHPDATTPAATNGVPEAGLAASAESRHWRARG